MAIRPDRDGRTALEGFEKPISPRLVDSSGISVGQHTGLETLLLVAAFFMVAPFLLVSSAKSA